MGKETDKIDEGIRDFRKESSREFGIEEIVIFGSAVRGKMKRDSDIDLIIVSKKFRGKKFFKRGIGLHKYWKLDYPVDFLCYTPEEFKKNSKKVSIVSQALKDGRRLA
jgi:uncharacterized protein